MSRPVAVTPDDITGVLGILPAPSVPGADHWSCTQSLALDEIARMTARIRAGGIRILLTGGSFGEGASLTEDEHVALAGCVAETLAGTHGGDGLLFAGATTLNTRETIARARRLVDAGATGLFLGRPMWMALDHEGSLRFYRDVTEALPGVPIIVYDNQFAFKNGLSTQTYAALADIPEIIATKHIGGPGMADALRAVAGRMKVLPVDAQWAALARDFPAEATACWTGNCADGTEPLAALASAISAGDLDRADHVCARMVWAQTPMFPGGKLESFVDYNVPIAHGRLQGSGLVRSGPPRPPYTVAPEGHWEGGRETGRRWAALCAEFAPPGS